MQGSNSIFSQRWETREGEANLIIQITMVQYLPRCQELSILSAPATVAPPPTKHEVKEKVSKAKIIKVSTIVLITTGQLPVIILPLLRVGEARVRCSHLVIQSCQYQMVRIIMHLN